MNKLPPTSYSPPAAIILSAMREASGSLNTYVDLIWAARDFEQVRRPVKEK